MRLSALVETSDGALQPVPPIQPDPQVSAVVTTDLLDPRRYLSGGELVLTGLAWWRPDQPGRSRGFVVALVSAGAVALGAGEAELGAIPDDLVEACAEAGLPLLRVPVAYSFSAVIDQFGLVERDDLVAVLARHRALLAARARPSSGLTEVLALVAADLDAACWVLAPSGRVVDGSAEPADPREARILAREFLRAPRLPHTVGRPGRRVVSLFAGGEPAERAATWFLAVDSDHHPWRAGRRSVVAELSELVEVEQAFAVQRSEAERRLSVALTGADPAEVEAALGAAGLGRDVASVVVVGDGGPVLPVLAEALTVLLPPSVSGLTGPAPAGWALGPVPPGGALAVVPAGDPADLLGQLRVAVEALAPGLGPEPVRIGLSDPVTGGVGLLAAVAEARSAIAAAESGHRVVGPERLSSHSVLLAAVPVDLRRAYQSRVLGPLLEHDRVHRTELVHTLAEYLACSASWSKCAAQMHLHVNTLRYRIERIEALTGRDLRRLTDQVDLLLALDALGERGPGRVR